ncbi:MAG: winged helix-turn-helix domain-containing protein [Blastocatellia bacterium]
MQSALKRIYEFDSFRIDPQECQLTQNGRVIPLTAKVFEILLALVENRGRTLRKDELMEKVWADSFVEEGNLSRNISTLRKVLGDDFHNPRFIKTVPKRGYRFEWDVREILEETDDLFVERRTRYNLALGGKAVSIVTPYFRYLAVSLTVLVLIGGALALAIGWSKRNEALSEPVANAEAFELYKRGRELWQNRSAAGLHEATLLLEQSVEKDPDFALGYAALADAYAFDTGNWKKTEEMANRAIGLDSNLGEPHASIGFVKFFWEWKIVEAEVHFKKAIAHSPDYATGHQWFAIKLAANGQFNQALAEMSRALELEPGSVAINADMCQLLYFLRRYDEAETQCTKTLEIEPNSFNARRYLYQVYTAKGMYQEAVDEFFKSEQLSVNHATLPDQLIKLETAYKSGGIRKFWRTQIEILNGQTPDTGYMTAWYFGLLGEKNEALRCLQISYENKDFGFILFRADPVFSKFFDDPRFVELHEKLFDQDL